MMRATLHRGSALLAALIIIGVLALVTVATLQLAGISKQSSVADSRKLSQTSCAEAARRYLLGRLRLLDSAVPASVTLNRAITVETGTRIMRTGHMGNTAVINSVRSVGPNIVPANTKSRDVANIIARSTMGATGFRTVVTCSDPLAGDMELEFTFKYGL
jgi:hypothetical protein